MGDSRAMLHQALVGRKQFLRTVLSEPKVPDTSPTVTPRDTLQDVDIRDSFIEQVLFTARVSRQGNCSYSGGGGGGPC